MNIVTPAVWEVDHAVLDTVFDSGIAVVIAVSGGADSIVLLDALDRINRTKSLDWRLQVVHVNHRLRGAESDADADFVRALCERSALAVEVVSVDTGTYARERHLSIETAAREQRYAALEDCRARHGAAAIVVAHTRDDQAETVLLRLLRGSGVHGLAGMRPRSGYLVRPLLTVSRATVHRVVVEQALPYREDSSNTDTRYARNFLRHNVIPQMEKIQPRTVPAVARAAGLLTLDSHLLTLETEGLISFLDISTRPGDVQASTPAWQALHPSLQGHSLAMLFAMVLGDGRDVHDEHIAAAASVLRDNKGTTLRHQLPHNLSLEIGSTRFAIRTESTRRGMQIPVLDLTVPGDVRLPRGRVTARVLPNMDRSVLNRWVSVAGPLHLIADAEKLGRRLRLRSRRPGDRLRPLGMDGTRKVQDILTDKKIARSERDAVIVLENDDHIVWLVGLTIDSRVAVHAESTTIAHIVYTPVGVEIP